MGIESDQVVYEYLSRVGDVAQQRQLPSATRMRLVAELRGEIDRRRSQAADSPAAVRRILDRLGSPDEVVSAAGGTRTAAGGGAPTWPSGAAPVRRDEPAAASLQDPERRSRLRRVVPRQRPPGRPASAPAPAAEGASPPHLAAAHELGDGAAGQPPADWWRVEGAPLGAGESVPGFVGGVEIPELLRPPPAEDEQRAAARPTVEAEPEEAAPAAGTAGRRLPRLWPEGGWNNPLLLLAAALLAVGAVLGNLLPLALGWLITFLSRRLTRAQAKWAVLGLPGLVAAAGIVWLWGRTDGRWGDPIVQGQMSTAVADTWPWVLRGAALASALYLIHRARHPRS
ncbi:hypothetical protein [Streptomyces poriticola]|uniref:hypothetical protein n=1 Tax=Streptomyces poriticola TaxID=3120506 RepID=UPI002FCDE404